ncbi:histidine-rich glycoprotein-like isoform X3 [Cololabis saira]|nr:histidine-rich glycoprotein-like isoform X2 [Cololabis saira]XP_061594920.1 histidine-rich glycoprotein-like isoform X3 [Cololabis saira]
MAAHGEAGVVFYLTLDVVDTNCSVLSRRDWKICEARSADQMPTYGQCKAAIYISKVHRVVRLYKYDCVVRPVPAGRVAAICPDCSPLIGSDNDQIKNTVSLSLGKFNKDSGLKNYFSVLKVERATTGYAMGNYYHVEFSVQETSCPATTDAPEKCTPLDCEFAHKGFCKASLYNLPTGDEDISVECEIFEPEAAEKEKKLHLLGGETDHSHNDTGAAAQDQTHDHVHDHTKGHAHHDQKHAEGGEHHHTHDHAAGGAHRHAHDHSHDHGHGHDHVHAHHAKAHDHSQDPPNHHHDYKHPEGDTHHHDHELALDHDHKHAHLHEHEHHHHHHKHEHEGDAHHDPQGSWRSLPSLDQPMTMPSFPDAPAGPEAGVTLPLKPDPQIPGVTQPSIQAFPAAVSAQCPAPALREDASLVETLFTEDPMFKAPA